MPPTDESLMQRAQRGETAAFEELVARYRAALLRVAISKLGDRTTAEDVVQETLLAAFAARQTFDPRYPFRTWIWTITLHLCQLDWKRRQRPVRAGGVIDPALADGPTPEPTALDVLVSSERAEQLHQALRELPEAEADALRLRFFAGLKFEEISAAMRSSVSGAKQRVKHGLARLADRLQALSGVES